MLCVCVMFSCYCICDAPYIFIWFSILYAYDGLYFLVYDCTAT